MNIPKPPEVEDEVSELFLYGHSTEEISKTCKVSTGYVSGVASKLKERLGNKEVSAIRELCRIFKKLGISAAEAFDGARIISILKEFGANIDDFRAMLTEVLQKCQKENIDPAKLAYQCRAITQIQAKINVPLEDLPDECARLLDTKNELEKKISLLEEEADKANAETAKALSEKNQTKKSLEEFEHTKKELDSFELGFNNISKLINVLKQAADEGYSTDKIIKHLEKEGNYEQRIEELEQQVKQLRAQETIQNRKVKELSKKIEAKKLLVTRLRRLDRLRIKDKDLEILYQTVLDIAKEHNIDEKTALQKLDRDLRNNYNKKIGLGIHLEKLQNEILLKKQELESNQVKIENLDLKHKENLKTLQILKELKKNQINPELIVVWNRIFRSANLDPKIFLQKLSKIGDLNKINEIEQETVKQLREERIQLESKVNWLKSQKEELESIIKYGKEFAIEQIAQTIKHAQNQILKTGSSATNSISFVRTKAVDGINTVTEKTDKHLSDRLAMLDESITTGMTVSEKIGKFQTIIPLLELINGSKYDVCEAFTCLLILLDKLSLQIQKNGKGSQFFLEHIKCLREDLMEAIRQN